MQTKQVFYILHEYSAMANHNNRNRVDYWRRQEKAFSCSTRRYNGPNNTVVAKKALDVIGMVNGKASEASKILRPGERRASLLNTALGPIAICFRLRFCQKPLASLIAQFSRLPVWRHTRYVRSLESILLKPKGFTLAVQYAGCDQLIRLGL